ncbi:MAG: hypothetical protein AABW88_04860 [Nanoarchaeota archaeon]|mgnify:FL=1
MEIKLNTEKETLTDLRRIKHLVDSRIAEITGMSAELSCEESVALSSLRELGKLVSIKDFEEVLLNKGYFNKEDLPLIIDNLKSKGEAYQPKEGFLSPI